MPKDLDDISKKIDVLHKDLDRQNSEVLKDVITISKDQDKVLKDIIEIKKQVKDIGYKVDLMLEILNNFTIMLAEDDTDLEDDYDSDESWVPKDEEFWEDDENEEL